MAIPDTWSNTISFRDFRVPYLPELFPRIAQELALQGHEKVLDIACGTGKLAFGLVPYTASLTGVDTEQPMLDQARQYADENNIEISLIHSRVEDMPQGIGPFDLVTIGKAHWFLDANVVIPRLEAVLVESGKILVCGAFSESPWQSIFLRVRKKWTTSPEKSRITPDDFFAGSSFSRSGAFVLEEHHQIPLEHAIKRGLAFPGTTLASLGDKAEGFTTELEQALLPFTRNGMLTEVQKNTGHIYSRDSVKLARKRWF